MTTPRADRVCMQNRWTFGILNLAVALMLAGCASSPAYVSTSVSRDYERAFRAERYAEAARLASQVSSRDAEARLIEGMARAELDQPDRAGALLRPLVFSADPEIRGRAAATLGLLAQEQGNSGEAGRLLGIASDSLTGTEGVWAARYAARARTGTTGTPAANDAPTGTAADGAYQIQFGSFSTQARAQRHAQAVSRITRSTGLTAPRIETVQRGARTLYAVRAGSFSSRSAAASAASRLNTETAVIRTQ